MRVNQRYITSKYFNYLDTNFSFLIILSFVFTSRKLIVNEKDFIFNEPLEDGVNAAYMTSLTDVIYRNKKTYKSFILKICKEQLLTTKIVMYFPKHFFFKDAIDNKLAKLATSGFLKYWIDKYVNLSYLTEQKQVKGPVSLKLNNLFGILNFWMIGLVISLVIFLVEILHSMFKIRRSANLSANKISKSDFSKENKKKHNRRKISKKVAEEGRRRVFIK